MLFATARPHYPDSLTSMPRCCRRGKWAAEGLYLPPSTPGIAALEGFMRWDLDAALSGLRVPVTTFAARALLAPEAVERYGDRIEIVPVDNGGHFYLRERPSATAALLADLGAA